MARSGMVKPLRKSVVFVTFESEFAPLGGLSAVMRMLPKRMARIGKGECMTIAPFFREITKCKPDWFEAIHPTGYTFDLAFGEEFHTVEVFRHCDRNGFQTILLDSPQFFNAPCDCGDPPHPLTPCNPYLNPGHPGQLLQDALFFCAAVPRALVALGITKNLVLNLQDWETACLALTIKEEPTLVSAACVLTVHNPYDKPLPDKELQKISRQHLPGPTVLSKMIPLLDGPICTVSQNFARELVKEPLHTVVYVPHLQSSFRHKGVRGINNGLFAKLNFPKKARDDASQGDFGRLLREKSKRREGMITVLREYNPPQAWGRLDFSHFEGPVFLMFGRDDPRQKGYDLAAAAIARIPEGKAKFIFTPIPGEEGLEGLRFLRTLAERKAGAVKIFPFRMERGYMELQKGASFMVMCSLYEPFGGATEGYAVGTPILARATGGLVQQVVPYPSSCLNRTVRTLFDQFHDGALGPTGILFREAELPPAQGAAGWRTIVHCRYWPDGDRLADRIGTPLFEAMVQEATKAFMDAIELYVHNPADYARMIYNGFGMLDRFSWDQTVREYQALYTSL